MVRLAPHVRFIAATLERRNRRADVDYLAVCGPADVPLRIGAVDYAERPGTGMLWQLAVMPALQSRGIGTVLVAALEEQIRQRGLPEASLLVEDVNVRAHGLYERLGYAAIGRATDSWEAEQPDGTVVPYEAVCLVMARRMSVSGIRSDGTQQSR